MSLIPVEATIATLSYRLISHQLDSFLKIIMNNTSKTNKIVGHSHFFAEQLSLLGRSVCWRGIAVPDVEF